MRMYKRSATLNPVLSGSLTNGTPQVINTGAYGIGYFGGGANGSGNNNTIDGINFLTEVTVAPSAVLSTKKVYATGLSSALKGYFCGTWNGSWTSIDVLNFTTQAASLSTSVLGSTGRSDMAGVGNSVKGYLVGGTNPANAMQNKIENLTYANDVVALLSAVLSRPRQRLGGVNSSTKGYFAGGFNSDWSESNEIDGIDFSTDAAINPSAVLSVGRAQYPVGLSSSLKGYFCGGGTSSPGLARIDGIVFSTEAAFTSSATMADGRYVAGGAGSSLNGYIAGGTTPMKSSIERLNFTSESTILTTANLTVARTGIAGVSYIASAPVIGSGYACGGTGAAQYTNTEKLKFNSETNSVVSSAMTYSYYYGSGTYSNVSGYVAAGSGVLDINKLIFATDIFSAIAAKINTSKSSVGAIQSAIKGYFNTITYPSGLVDALVFGTDTISTLSAIVSSTTDNPETLSSSTKGYICGGYRSGGYSTKIDGFVFSTEANAVISSSLDLGRGYGKGLSSSNVGYLINGVVTTGGNTVTKSISKMTFSTEVCSSIAATVSKLRNYCSGYTSSARAYMSAGFDNGTNINTIDALSLSTETTTVISATLTTGRYGAASLQSSN